MRVRVFWRAVVGAVRAARLTSVILVLLLAGAAAFTVLTAGRTAATQAAVLAKIDSAALRTVTLVGSSPVGFDASLVADVAAYPFISEVVGLGPVADYTVAQLPQGTRIPGRVLYLPRTASSHLLPQGEGLPQSAFAGPGTLAALGVQTAQATLARVADGDELLVLETRPLPTALAGFGPQVLVPQEIAPDAAGRNKQRLGILLVTAARVQDVEPLLGLLRGYVADLGGAVQVQPPADMAQLQDAIAGELVAGNRAVLLGTFAACALTTSIVVWAVVLLRRRDYGRRRALGATQRLIIGLTLAQVVVLAAAAGTLGTWGAALGLLLARAPVPPVDFLLAVPLALCVLTAAAALLPAAWAAKRDPLTELRTP